MGTARIVSVMAALASLATSAGLAYGQNQSTPDQPQTTPNTTPAPAPSQGETRPNAASSPHQRDVTKQPGQESVPNENANPAAASSPHQQQATRMAEAGPVEPGMSVQTRSGQSLGTVVDIVPGAAGDAKTGYVVIAAAGGTARPVPYSSASSMVQNGKLVMDRSRLMNAPTVQQNQLEDHSSTTWKKKADSYWGKGQETHGTRSEEMQEQQPKDHSMTPDQSGGPSPR
jgi:hypothetical protein